MTAYKIQIIEPFYTGSHQQWAEGWQKHSRHTISILSLPGRYWKWRMYGGAVTLAQQFLAQAETPDLLIVSDMLDLTTFLALTRKRTTRLPIAIYFHENQITYPWSPTDADVKLQRNNQYGFLNYTSALAADHLFFNSAYHQDSFLGALTPFLKQFPDCHHLENIEKLHSKSSVLHLGIDFKRFLAYQATTENEIPIILWNHRWEYDKNPEAFFKLLFHLKKEAIPFQLIVLGESYHKQPAIFAKAHKILATEIIHWGYASDFATYAQLLWKADLLPVTNHQDFFGGSIVEAIFCNNFPLLPNRLAYPEHIPVSYQQEHLYQTEEDLYRKTEDYLLQYPTNKQQGMQQNFVIGYDWSTLAAEYDRQMAVLMNASS